MSAGVAAPRGRAATVAFVVGLASAVVILAVYAAHALGGACRFGKLAVLLAPGAATLLLAVMLGAACAAGRRSSRAALAAAAVVAAVAMWPAIADRVREVVAAGDGFRLTALLTWGGVAGLGLYLGQRGAAALRGGSVGCGPWRVLAVGPSAAILALGGAWLPALAVLWLSATARAVGETVCAAALGAAARAPAAVQFAVGTTVLAPLVLALGLVGASSATGLLAAWLAITVLLMRPTRRAAADLLRGLAVAAPASPATAAVRGMLSALVAVYLVAALGPETGWDATALRVAAPARWLEAGAIAPLPELAATYGVCGGEALSLLLMPLTGTSATRLLTLAAFLVLLRSFREDALSRPGAAASVLMFPLLASSLLWWQMCAGMVDLVQAVHVYAAVLAVQCARDPSRGGRGFGWLALAGLCGGGAAAIKWNGGLALPLLVVLAAAPPRHRVRAAAVVAAAFVVVVAPWMVRSLWLTGNPVFPFANAWFDSALAPHELVANRFGIGLDPIALLRLPVAVFFSPSAFGEQGTLHPSLLALTPLGVAGLWLRAAPAADCRWLGAGAIAWLLWAATEQNARYGLPVAILLAVAIAIGVDAWHAQVGRRGGAALLAVATVAAWSGAILQRCPAGDAYWNDSCDALLPAEVVLGVRPVDDYLSQRVATYDAARWLHRHAAGPSRVWLLEPLRGDNLYFPQPTARVFHGVVPRMQPLADIARAAAAGDDVAALHRGLVDLGYTHLVDWSPRDGPVPIPAPAGLTGREAWRRGLDPCLAAGRTRLFALRPAPRSDVEIAQLFGTDQLAAQAPADRRELTVSAGALYELEVAVAAGAQGAEMSVRLVFLDAAGTPVGEWSERVRAAGGDGAEGFLHTAPAQSTRMSLSLAGDRDRFHLRWRRVRTGGGD